KGSKGRDDTKDEPAGAKADTKKDAGSSEKKDAGPSEKKTGDTSTKKESSSGTAAPSKERSGSCRRPRSGSSAVRGSTRSWTIPRRSSSTRRTGSRRPPSRWDRSRNGAWRSSRG